jgi:CheY-like chemotaxis protein
MVSSILLIDDDQDDLETYKYLLGEIAPKIVVTSFLNPKQALRYLESLASLPDLVIADFNMPQMNGLDFLKRVRRNPSLARLVVTVVTTSCNPRDAEELLSLGAVCHSKPSGLDDFRALLRKLITPK